MPVNRILCVCACVISFAQHEQTLDKRHGNTSTRYIGLREGRGGEEEGEGRRERGGGGGGGRGGGGGEGRRGGGGGEEGPVYE